MTGKEDQVKEVGVVDAIEAANNRLYYDRINNKQRSTTPSVR